MTQTKHVEMRDSEGWADTTHAFMEWCLREKKITRGGCHKGDAIPSADGLRYAAISIPGHSPELMTYLVEWAQQDGRKIK